MSSWTVSTFRNMTSATLASSAACPSTILRRRSDSVTIPTSRPSSTTGSWLMPASFIRSTASPSVSSPQAVMTSRGGSLARRDPQESCSHEGRTKPCCFIHASSMNFVM